MSTFSGLSTALSSLIAQRQALEVTGQNLANINTPGYTRQRVEMQSISAGQGTTMFSQPNSVGNGVQAVSVSRLGDIFMDARVRTTSSSAAYLAARTDAFTRLESTIAEPGTKGISADLDKFWASWNDVVNSPTSEAVGEVLLEHAASVQRSIATGYTAVVTQWDQTRSQAESLVSDINTTASAVALLNDQIQQISVSGGNANELIDHRNVLTTTLSSLAGATVRLQPNGTVDVNIGGNPIVTGSTAQKLKLVGSREMVGAAGDEVRVEWDRTPAGSPVPLDGGRLAGVLSTLSPAAGGSGGMLAEAAESYNTVARRLADSVNQIHAGGMTRDGRTGVAFFELPAAGDPTPAALGLRVAATSAADLAVRDPANGVNDTSFADKISKLGSAAGGPDAAWSTFVVSTGVKAKAALQSATVAEAARSTAAGLQLAQTSVDQDEEGVNMLSFQRAYQGAARVMTAVDEMLDQLINRTGVVGR